MKKFQMMANVSGQCSISVMAEDKLAAAKKFLNHDWDEATLDGWDVEIPDGSLLEPDELINDIFEVSE